MSLDLIRNGPQFDEDILKPGVAIKYKSKHDGWTNAIIINVYADRLFIVQYDSSYDYSDKNIYLKDVLDENIDINILS